MRVRHGAIGWLALTASAVVCAQSAGQAVRGTVVVWWVEPSTLAQRDQVVLEHILPSVPRLPLDQRSASELGQNSSTFGQSAGGYGQNASTYGTNASDFGQNAGSVGKPASEVGHAASDTGQTASSYGQNAGSYGQTASTFGVAASDTGKLPKPRGPEPVTVSSAQQKLLDRLRLVLPGISVQVVPVLDLMLSEKLAAVERTASCPDIVVGAESSWLGQSAASQVSLSGLPLAPKPTRGEATASPAVQQSLAVMRHAPHPVQARALVSWLQRNTER